MKAPLFVALVLASLSTASCGDDGCSGICADLDAYRRFQCNAPPFNLCDCQGRPARPLTKEEAEYVMMQKRRACDCSACSSVQR